MDEAANRAASLAVMAGGAMLLWWAASTLTYDLDEINREAAVPSKNPRYVTGECLLPVVLDETTRTTLPDDYPDRLRWALR